MIVYRSTKKGFQDEVERGDIDLTIEKKFFEVFHKRTTDKEVDSWWNSLHYMSTVLNDPEIPDNTGIAIECQIPQTNKRIDFVITGTDENNKPNVVIIELKQWKTAELSDKDGIIKTALGKGVRETSHPSYQAWSYATFLHDYSETVRNENITLSPCAYLHNYVEDQVIRNPFYDNYLNKAPVFLKRDPHKLRDFIKRYVKKGDDGEIMYRIDSGKIRPSKQLSESLASLLKGNAEFIMLDEQKLVYETA